MGKTLPLRHKGKIIGWATQDILGYTIEMLETDDPVIKKLQDEVRGDPGHFSIDHKRGKKRK